MRAREERERGGEEGRERESECERERERKRKRKREREKREKRERKEREEEAKPFQSHCLRAVMFLNSLGQHKLRNLNDHTPLNRAGLQKNIVRFDVPGEERGRGERRNSCVKRGRNEE
jgi:hypothetical protein